MPQSYSGRIVAILVVLLAGLWSIFPALLKDPVELLSPSVPFTSKLNLKPGIDMVGGTSLLYEIQVDPQATLSGDVAEQVMEALKKRVDPEGVRNLVWRPQGATRLEIQMPLSKGVGKGAELREAFSAAREVLERTNVRPGQVLAAVETLAGDARTARLTELAGGYETRARLFASLAETFDKLSAARKAQDAAAQAENEIAYDRLKRDIEKTNLSSDELEAVLESAVAATRTARLGEIRAAAAAFPARAAAIDGFVKAYDTFSAVKGNLEDAADLKRLLRGSGVLEFYITADRTDAEISDRIETMTARLQPGGRGPAKQSGDILKWVVADRPDEFTNDQRFVVGTWNDKSYVLVDMRPGKSLTQRTGLPWALKGASPQRNPQTMATEVAFSFDVQGAAYFGELTANNIRQPLGIVLDDKIISAPNINSRIDGYGTISGGGGGFTLAELRYLVATLNAGSLPARLADDPISERTVGPQLGEDNLRAGLFACLFGLFVVAVFLIGYYYLSGVVAFIAVLMNMVLILGFMAALNATFTLPGIAGIVLTIGMAVDANVLIFERLREEQQRGMNIRMALRNAYDKAWYAIVDSNVTTGITSLGLYLFGSEEVKGFGLTLLLGIMSSMFTALFVTKTIFGLLIDRFDIKKLGSIPLSIPSWDRLLRPDIDWMKHAKWFIGFSSLFIVVGLILFGIRFSQGAMLDIEFARGTSVQFELKEATPIAQVRALISDESHRNPALPSPAVVSVGTDDRSYEVVTPNEKASEVRAAVVAAVGDRLNLRVPSRFAGAGAELEAALAAATVVPIESAAQVIAGFNPPDVPDHLGGVAIVLNDLTPPLTPKEILKRIEEQRLQVMPGQRTQRYRPVAVDSPAGIADQPTSTAIIMTSDTNFPFDSQDDVKRSQWETELAGPMLHLVNEAITAPADLQKVSNFDAQVAGQTTREAIVALFIAILGIVAYVWVRFGNLKYGAATVLALAHDTLFVLGAIGVCHYVAETAFGRSLMLEPFRINLTMVAAILTVMGYSMNDTVVVFDRIRENRDKLGGKLSRKIINDSINQTLSRTLLTGGTTLVTIAVMYITGGPGIHGFTFALLVGILVGTYSSIAIAAPLLLLGLKNEQAVVQRPAKAAALPPVSA
jgi:SecD/SecF fusion protein